MEQKLANLIKKLAESELQCDLARLDLKQSPGFDVKISFKLLDSYDRDVLNTSDIYTFLKNNKVSASEDEILYIIDSYDKNQTGRLSLKDFTDLVTPKILSLGQEKREISKDDVQPLLKVLFERELELLRTANPLRAAIQELRGYTHIDIFKLIDRGRSNSINYEDLDDFMQRQGIYLTNAELIAFFKRIDKSNASRISYWDFKKNVLTNASPMRGLANSSTRMTTLISGTDLLRINSDDHFNTTYARNYTTRPNYTSSQNIDTNLNPNFPESFTNYTRGVYNNDLYPLLEEKDAKRFDDPSSRSYEAKNTTSAPQKDDYYSYPMHKCNPYIKYRYPSLSRPFAYRDNLVVVYLNSPSSNYQKREEQTNQQNLLLKSSQYLGNLGSTAATIPQDLLTSASDNKFDFLEAAKRSDSSLKGKTTRGLYDLEDVKIKNRRF